ncbi:cora family metal ion transporter-like protein [Lineolata rhizophorae]|uniref:Cora family metal ion transporter-like protein n=1 Tax=Lineolata rhizophorae TaxID=578093 RepID=A0A6A6P041_9PEZI|nr:cora family metal ion transporter-like protein [Lineolata rhizophorae]
MSGTPHSEACESRFSTPVSELDDHRNQPVNLPPPEHGYPPGSRRETFSSTANSERPNLVLQVEENLRQGMTSRDFENAITEEPGDRVNEQTIGDTIYNRRGSSATSPIARRNTFRRSRTQQQSQQQPQQNERMPTASRSSSPSAHTISPRNSMEAFADHKRRERAGTLNSVVAPPLSELYLNHTISGGTHQRRPTISENKSPCPTGADSVSTRSSVEDDVCFPQPEHKHDENAIDYDELESYARECRLRPKLDNELRRKPSTVASQQRRVFYDQRPQSSKASIPRFVARSTPTPGGGEDACSVVDEKDPELAAKHADLIDALDRAKSSGDPAPAESTPTMWTFFSADMNNCVFSDTIGGLLMEGETFRDLFELPDQENGEQQPVRGSSAAWWLDLLNPSEDDITAVCRAFGVHPLTREDICTQETREKVELFKRYYFVCFRSFNQDSRTSDEYMEPINVYAVVFRDGLLTFTFCPSPHAANVRKRVGRLRDYVSMSSDWICYALIDDIVDAFQPAIREIEQETDLIEDNVFTARAEDSRQILRQIGDCRKKVMSLMRLIGGKADVIKGFSKRCNTEYEQAPRSHIGVYLSDVQDHVVTMMTNLQHFEKMLSRSHSNYLAQISVDNLAQGNSVNETLGKVTVLATILVPLNLICGLFGMNVNVPGGGAGGLGWFFGILGVIVMFVIICLVVAKKKRYL